MLFSDIGRPGWDPFAEMRRLQTEMNRLFDATESFPAAGVYPPINLWLGDGSVVVTTELPGLSAEEVDLTIRDDTLTIRGERRPDEKAERAGWHRRERPYGAFSRTVGLPFRVDPDHVQARFENGLLQVEMHRPEAERPRRIAINGKKD